MTGNYATSDGTAIAGSDYLSTSNSFLFTPGLTTQTIVVVVLGDTNIEGNETFTVSLSGVVGASLGVGSATGTIINDD